MTSEKTPHDVTLPSQEVSLNNTASEMQVDAHTRHDSLSPSPEKTPSSDYDPEHEETMRSGGLKIAVCALSLIVVWYLFSPTLTNLVVWNFEDLLIGDVSSDTVFLQRLHAYVTDDESTCEVPEWVPEGTLVTARDDCQVPKGWEVKQLPHANVPTFDFAMDACSRGERMLCLILSNSHPLPFGSRHRKNPLHQLTRQTLSLYTNEDYSWSCNPSHPSACQVIPGGSAPCILEAMAAHGFGSEHDKKGSWKRALDHCKIHQSSISWRR